VIRRGSAYCRISAACCINHIQGPHIAGSTMKSKHPEIRYKLLKATGPTEHSKGGYIGSYHIIQLIDRYRSVASKYPSEVRAPNIMLSVYRHIPNLSKSNHTYVRIVHSIAPSSFTMIGDAFVKFTMIGDTFVKVSEYIRAVKFIADLDAHLKLIKNIETMHD
jgi:hypothetical protein